MQPLPDLTIIQAIDGRTQQLLFSGAELPVPILDEAAIGISASGVPTVTVTIPIGSVTTETAAAIRRRGA
ncbi:hypothetical protein [Gordonia alkaliphila]|uniref:Uncharacterized protein n=1 Tax=Gordonia alkaliphila TaxID=1053547 RepID=A0ABP8ZJV9_9ACTN